MSDEERVYALGTLHLLALFDAEEKAAGRAPVAQVRRMTSTRHARGMAQGATIVVLVPLLDVTKYLRPEIEAGLKVVSWEEWRARFEDPTKAVHTYPVGDVIEHVVDGDETCPCGPETEPVPREDGSMGWHVVHHSLDGREFRERGEEPPREAP